MRFKKIVFKERIYKIWKQFTTPTFYFNPETELCSKNEYTKSESNSQPESKISSISMNCVQRTNIQNLKAIHNPVQLTREVCGIVFKERIYKIWKQFTTRESRQDLRYQLCSKNEYTKSESNSQHLLQENRFLRYCVQRTNIQNLKAIHNQILFQRFF